MPRVVHFEIFATDPEEVVNFYETVFHWQISNWSGQPYWLANTGPEDEAGIHGAIAPRGIGDRDFGPLVNTIAVPDLDDYLRRVIAAGGSVAQPKSPIPGVGWLAYCRDPEGTIFGMMQNDPGAM